MEVWKGGRDGLAPILQTLSPQLGTFAFLHFKVSGAACLASLGLFCYQLFICLAFYVILPEDLAMEHLTRRGSKLKNFHLHPELLLISRGLRVCLPRSFMMGLWFQLSLQIDILSLFRKWNSRNLYQTLMIAYALCRWNNRVVASRTERRRQLCNVKRKSAPVPPACSQFPQQNSPPTRMLGEKIPAVIFNFRHSEV